MAEGRRRMRGLFHQLFPNRSDVRLQVRVYAHGIAYDKRFVWDRSFRHFTARVSVGVPLTQAVSPPLRLADLRPGLCYFAPLGLTPIVAGAERNSAIMVSKRDESQSCARSAPASTPTIKAFSMLGMNSQPKWRTCRARVARRYPSARRWTGHATDGFLRGSFRLPWNEATDKESAAEEFVSATNTSSLPADRKCDHRAN